MVFQVLISSFQVVIMSSVGNIFVLITLALAKDPKVRSNYFMFNLSVAELLLGRSLINQFQRIFYET